MYYKLQFAFMIHQKNRWATTGRFSHSLRVFASAAHVLSIMTINGECFNRQFNYSKLSEWNILIKSIQHFSFSSTPPTRLHSLTLSSFCFLLAVYFLFFSMEFRDCVLSCHVDTEIDFSYISRVALSLGHTLHTIASTTENGVWIHNEASQICCCSENMFCSFSLLGDFPSRSDDGSSSFHIFHITQRHHRRLFFPHSRLLSTYCLVQQHTYLPEILRASIWGSEWIDERKERERKSSMTPTDDGASEDMVGKRVGEARRENVHCFWSDVVYKPSSKQGSMCSEHLNNRFSFSLITFFSLSPSLNSDSLTL